MFSRPLAACLLAGSLAGDHSSGLDGDERVFLVPGAAAQDATGAHWRLPIHAWVYEPEVGDPMRAALLRPLREALAVTESATDADRFVARARWFLVDNERGEHVNLAVGDRRWRLGPTGADGRFETLLELPLAAALGLAPDGRLPLRIGDPGDPTGTRGTIALVPPEGVSILSDLDDTVKVTEVRNSRAALANTFLHEFRAVPGMAALYQRLAQRGATLHFVSLGPWQLAPELQPFLARAGFPPASLHLRRFRLKDESFFDLFRDAGRQKLELLAPFFASWPKRRFILIGDSGQQDPETYAELARRHPGQVERILIRDVTGEPSTAARYVAAFQGVDPGRWQIFTDPADVTDR